MLQLLYLKQLPLYFGFSFIKSFKNTFVETAINTYWFLKNGS